MIGVVHALGVGTIEMENRAHSLDQPARIEQLLRDN